jgi:TonB family protein
VTDSARMRSHRTLNRGLLAAALLLLASPVTAQEAPPTAPPEASAPAPQLTKAPELTHFVEAAYPPEAAAQELTASVRFIITIGPDGAVTDVLPQEPAGHGFDEAALAAVRQFRFTPAEVDGVPAPVQIEYVYHFTLRAPEPPPAAEAKEPEVPRAVLKGRLLSRGSRSRVAHATVRCGDDPAAPEALSNEEGLFELRVPAGECAARVIAQGFQPFLTTELLKPDETTEVVYHLAPAGGAFETVVRSERPKKEVVRRTVTRQEVQRTPGTFGDPIRVIQALPGVARAPYISGELLVRGSNPGQTATMMDGVRIPLLFHLLGGPSVVNSEFIDTLDFFPGGYGSQYGRAVGGIVDVTTRKGAADTFHGSAKVDLLDAGFFLEAPVAPGVSVAASARRSYIDVLLPAIIPEPEDGSFLAVAPRYWDYQVRVDFGAPRDSKPAPGEGRSTYYLMAFGSDDQLRLINKGGVDDLDLQLDFHTHFIRVKGDWTYKLGGFSSVFAPYVGYDLAKTSFGTFRQDADVYSVGARETVALELGERARVRTGFDLHFEHMRFEVQLPEIGGVGYVRFPGSEPRSEPSLRQATVNAFDGALFLETDLLLGPLTVTPGLRANLGRVQGGHRPAVLDPRLWLKLVPREHTVIKGSLGLYSQPPDTWRFFPEPFGNPLLDYQRAFQTSLGVEQRLGDSITVDITGFFNRRYENVVSPGRLQVNEDGSASRLPFSNDGIGKAYGLEVMVKKELTDKASGWISYTLSHSEDGRAGSSAAPGFGFGGPATTGYDISPYDQTHVLTVVTSYKLPYDFLLGTRFRHSTGRPYTPLDHQSDLYSADRNRFTEVRGRLLSSRLRGFHQLDVRVDKDFIFQSWTLTAYVDIQNVYNADNVEALDTDYRLRQEYEVPGLPFLPVVGVKGSF